MDRLTPDQAYRAMRAFLERRIAASPEQDVVQVLSDTQMLPDGRSADPASYREWIESVDQVLEEDAPPKAAAG